MDYKERENLRRKIIADLELLQKESWSIEVVGEIETILRLLDNLKLEGYDD